MLKNIICLSAAFLIAGPAAAQSVRINLVGKDPATIQSEISRAAARVCDEANPPGAFSYYLRSECVRRTVKVAQDRLAEGLAAAAGEKQVASR